MYFLRGSLPWQGLHVNRGEDRYKKILQKKKGTSADELCKGFPNEFVEYINYTRNLEFEADPDYNYLRGLLRTVLRKQNYEYDFYYDWLKENRLLVMNLLLRDILKIILRRVWNYLQNRKKKKKRLKKKENINIEKYNGLKTDIHTEGNKINISNEISKTDGDVVNGKDIVPTNSSNKTGDKKDKKIKDKKNKKCIII